jgi:hypothetical protein
MMELSGKKLEEQWVQLSCGPEILNQYKESVVWNEETAEKKNVNSCLVRMLVKNNLHMSGFPLFKINSKKAF